MVAQDLGLLNATIEIPSDYTETENGLSFINEDKGCIVMTDYLWNIDGPIYSLADVETQRETIVANLMQELEVSDYQILTAGPDQVGSTDAYQIYFEGTDSEGVSSELVIMAVDGYDFGCYFIITCYPKGDEVAEAEIHSIIQSFESNGAPEVSYEMWCAKRAGVKVIVDTSLAQGGGVDLEATLNVNGIGTVYEMYLYPTQADRDAPLGEGFGVEVGRASEFDISTPEQVVQYQKNLSGTNNETYTFRSGGVEWLAYDFTMAGKNFSYAGAMIDGECYFVGCMFNDSNKDTITALYNQAIASVRPYSG